MSEAIEPQALPAQPAGAEPAEAPPARKPTDWWGEIKGMLWLLLAVLALHSLVVKPFYIPSESMMPILLKGDRLAVTKYPYGWSWVSASFHILPEMRGRLLGRMPVAGDIVILSPPGKNEDWIKRVIAVPGDTVAVRSGRLILNGRPVKSERRPDALLAVDGNLRCDPDGFGDHRETGRDGKLYCRLPVVRETLPNGRAYDTIDEGPSEPDNFGPIKIPAGRVFVMGDNRDNSSDSRVSADLGGLGGPVPWENIGGRAEFIMYSYDGSVSLNPVTWVSGLRGGRAGTSLRGHKAE